VASFLAASRALVGVAARSLADAGDITLAQFRALVVLAGGGGLRASELAAALGVHQSTATRLCDRLVRKGLVGRSAEEADRRAVTVEVTPAGCRLVARVTRRRARDIAAVTARMSPAERDGAVAALAAFAASAGEPDVDLFGWPA